MAFDIDVAQGDTPTYTLSLYAYGGVATWLSAGESVEAVYRHFDGTTVTESALAITDIGGEAAPAVVALPGPCQMLDPALNTPDYGPGEILITKIDGSGNRETMPAALTYNVRRL